MKEIVYYSDMKIKSKQDYQKFINHLYELSDGEKFVAFQQKILNTQKTIVGIKTPMLRKLAKEIYSCSHDGLFKYGTNDIFEEVLVKGLVIAKHTDCDFAIQELNRLVKCFDTWAETDMICVSFKFFKGNEERLFNYFSELVKSEEEFVCRFGIVCLMKYFLDENNVDRTFKALDNVKCDKYYVNMAISWLICEALIKNPQNAAKNMQKIIKNHHFNSFIINKGIQKCCDSFRFDKETKNKLKELKIK